MFKNVTNGGGGLQIAEKFRLKDGILWATQEQMTGGVGYFMIDKNRGGGNTIE